jgi:hypothetical protein
LRKFLFEEVQGTRANKRRESVKLLARKFRLPLDLPEIRKEGTS